MLEDPRQVQGGERPRWTTERHLRLKGQVQLDTLGRMHETSAPRIAVEGYEVPTKAPDGHDLSREQRQILTAEHGVEVIRARACPVERQACHHAAELVGLGVVGLTRERSPVYCESRCGAPTAPLE